MTINEIIRENDGKYTDYELFFRENGRIDTMGEIDLFYIDKDHDFSFVNEIDYDLMDAEQYAREVLQGAVRPDEIDNETILVITLEKGTPWNEYIDETGDGELIKVINYDSGRSAYEADRYEVDEFGNETLIDTLWFTKNELAKMHKLK